MDTKKLKDLIEKAEALFNDVENIQVEMQEEFDERSDTWKESGAGEKYAESLEHLSEALNSLEGLKDNLADAMEGVK